ncbi:hypothetical protein IPH25_03515 [bacterium]|nr:MAG: hypothetical protein IPG37_00505 [bacterium]QQR61524.1 MAG: hypothetical protein IPH25_03515 [bacterium]QQR62948.1 MAG: hypothetical protein IPH67_00475 [bacterium]
MKKQVLFLLLIVSSQSCLSSFKHTDDDAQEFYESLKAGKIKDFYNYAMESEKTNNKLKNTTFCIKVITALIRNDINLKTASNGLVPLPVHPKSDYNQLFDHCAQLDGQVSIEKVNAILENKTLMRSIVKDVLGEKGLSDYDNSLYGSSERTNSIGFLNNLLSQNKMNMWKRIFAEAA